jgi:pyruvate/2-oxoacid:ferredoxin oxidoreductase alpha subunit
VQVLAAAAARQPHTLEAVDITDDAHWWRRYKYDIPVLHIGDAYWAKHRISLVEALAALAAAQAGTFRPQENPPDAEVLVAQLRKERKGA